MLENTCPSCNAESGMSCTLPNGAPTAPHNARNLATNGGRFSNTLNHALQLIAANQTTTAPEVAEAMLGKGTSQLNNVSGALRTLVEAGHLARVGKNGGRFLYGLPE